MEAVTITISQEKLQFLIDNNVLSMDEVQLKKVEIPDFDYSTNQQWVELSKKSRELYKQLKELEFTIRNGATK